MAATTPMVVGEVKIVRYLFTSCFKYLVYFTDNKIRYKYRNNRKNKLIPYTRPVNISRVLAK